MSTKLAIVFLVSIWFVTVRHIVLYGLHWMGDAHINPDGTFDNFERVWSWAAAVPLTALSVMVCVGIWYGLVPWVLN